MTNKEIKIKQIIYRSTHRGTKEMDLLLGNFVKKYIHTLDEKDLVDLENILLIDDSLIQKWYFHERSNNLLPKNTISMKLKNFKL